MSNTHIALRILFVEDEEAIIKTISYVLSAAGHHVYSARSGRQALTLLKSRAVDLVITDLLMPHMSGAEFLKKMRARVESATLPVVIYTNLPFNQAKFIGEKYDASAILTKTNASVADLMTVVATISRALTQASISREKTAKR